MYRTRLHLLAELGQAVWLDYIQRSMIASGQLQGYVDDGLRGLTSNPTIFAEAISGSNDYDGDLQRLARQGRSAHDIYEALAFDDIRHGADVLRSVYDQTRGADGYISLEVDPHLAQDTRSTLAEARRLFQAVDRPNVMIKVPVTKEGLPAIEALIAEGINVNITLMFSLAHYDQVSEAYLRGLEKRVERGEDLAQVASVASFFVSRVDSKVDSMLDGLATPHAQTLKGKIGIANAKVAYQRFKEVFQGERWEHLATRGARLQRVLWASTSTKDPAYTDTMYVDNLIGPYTINTMPPATLKAFMDHGRVGLSLERDLEEAEAQLSRLAELGIDLDDVTQQLLDEGITKFARPYDSLMDSITGKVAKLS